MVGVLSSGPDRPAIPLERMEAVVAKSLALTGGDQGSLSNHRLPSRGTHPGMPEWLPTYVLASSTHVDAVVTALRAPEFVNRQDALDTLYHIAITAPQILTANAAPFRSDAATIAAFAGLVEHGDARASEVFGALMLDREKGIRLGALRAVARFGDTKQLHLLREGLIDPAVSVQTQAAELLTTRGEDGRKIIRDALSSDNSQTISTVAWFIELEKDYKAIPDLIGLMERSNGRVAGQCAIALARLGAREAVPAIIKASNYTNDEGALCSVATALGELRDKRALPALQALSHSSSIHVADAAIEAMASINEYNSIIGRTSRALTSYLNGPSDTLPIQQIREDEKLAQRAYQSLSMADSGRPGLRETLAAVVGWARMKLNGKDTTFEEELLKAQVANAASDLHELCARDQQFIPKLYPDYPLRPDEMHLRNSDYSSYWTFWGRVNEDTLKDPGFRMRALNALSSHYSITSV